MSVNDNTFEVEGLMKLSMKRREGSAKAGTILATYETKTPGRALEIGVKVSSAAVSKVSRQVHLPSLRN